MVEDILMKKTSNVFENPEKDNKTVLLAILLAVFGILLFLAFALTLPWRT
jgi:hypothetical protein